MNRALIVSCAHGRDDGRVAARFGRTFQHWGFAVGWIGPETLRLGVPAMQPDTETLYASVTGRRGRITNVLKTAVRLLPVMWRRVEVVYCPEPDSALLAVLLLRRATHVVFDVHEVYHRQQLTRWVRSERGRRMASSLLSRLLRFVGRRCSVVVGVNEAVLEPFVSDPRIATILLHNTPSLDFQAAVESARAERIETAETVIYLGKASAKHGTRVAVHALSLCATAMPDHRFKLVLTVPPAGSAALESDALLTLFEELSVSQDQVQVLDPYPYSEAPRIMAAADIGLIAFTPDWGTDMTPNRLFEYMAAGLPQIVPTYARHMTSIVRESGAGLIVDTADPHAVAEAILDLTSNPATYASMSEAARRAFAERFNWDAEAEELRSRLGLGV